MALVEIMQKARDFSKFFHRIGIPTGNLQIKYTFELICFYLRFGFKTNEAKRDA